MDNNKNNNKTLRQKLRVLEKSIEAGLKNEKDFINLSAQDFYKLEIKCKMNKTDVALFFELADAVKSNKLITFLAANDAGGENDDEQH